MKYAKLQNGIPVNAPDIVRYRNTIVINPDAEKLMELGFKPVTFAEPQGVAPEAYVWSETWTETEDAIIQGWELLPEGDVSPEEALAILLGGEAP